MSKINYVLAKDEDFVKQYSGHFHYVGKESYVEIPHIIQGVPITSYEAMFSECSFIQGIKSTNKNIVSVRQMLFRCGSGDKTLDLSEFDMTNIENTSAMLVLSSFKEIIWPTDKMPRNLKDIGYMFHRLIIPTLDLSAFDFSEIVDSEGFVDDIKADNIIFPSKGLVQLLKGFVLYQKNILKLINPKYHTEELCWAAVLADKNQGKHVRIKSKKILMYLGSECPEYVEFYYNKGD